MMDDSRVLETERFEQTSESLSTGFIVIILMLLFYMTIGSALEHYHVPFGHEASFTVLMGMIISWMEFM